MHRLHHVLLGIFRNAHHTTVCRVAPGNRFPKEKNPYVGCPVQGREAALNGSFPHNQYSSNPVTRVILEKSPCGISLRNKTSTYAGCSTGLQLLLKP